jgi:signal recognition particle receptor subunit beta
MAAFDPHERKILVRVVYDGPGFAGKTTNIQQLHGFFTDRRRGDLITPEAKEGRTQFFDWMHLDGGLVHGHGLRCQLVSVPGQQALTKRRWILLRRADAVVFVCDSTPEGLEDGRGMFRTLHEYLQHHFGSAPPLVIQANKQDLPGALDPHTIRQSLGVAGDVPVVPATADTGAGVRETLVLAIRAAANRVQRVLLQNGLEGLSKDVETPEGLLGELRQVVVEPELLAASAPESAASSMVCAEEVPAVLPPSPRPDVMSGFIWPAATGRDVLRRLQSAGEPQLRADLLGQNGRETGSGGSHLLLFEAGMWCLKTSPRRCFSDVDEGRAALLRLARHKTALGGLLPPRTVLSLQTDATGSHWLWTVCPWMTPLRTLMEGAYAAGDDAALLVALSHYASAVVSSLLLAARRSVRLDVHPSNFAVVGEGVFYIDDDIDDGTTVTSFGHSVLQRVAEYEDRPHVVQAYVDRLLGALAVSLDVADARACGLEASLHGISARSPGVVAARQRIVGLLHELEGPRAEGR